ncbi:MAG: hypothetical protein ACRDE2_15195, partial [Chitinophagaceae bacterium]
GSAIYINFTNGQYMGNGYWNNLAYGNGGVNVPIPGGTTFSSLKDSLNNVTGIGLKVASSGWYSSYTYNSNGQYSTRFPQPVASSMFYNLTPGQTLQVIGLVPDSVYSFTIYAMQPWSSAYTGISIGTVSDTLYAYNNVDSTITISGVRADSSGTVSIGIYKTNNADGVAAINALVIHCYGIIQAAPAGLSLTPANGNVNLSWQRPVSKVDSIKVYRATSQNGSYTLLNPGMANGDSTSYTDSTVTPSTTYYYYLVAADANGQSPSSDTASISLAPPTALQMQPLAGQQPAPGTTDTLMVHLTASDSTVIFSLQNAPAFAAIQPLNDSTARVILTPSANNVGIFNKVQVVAALANKDTASQSFNISVTDGGIYSKWYIDFTTSNYLVGQPWNNIPFSGGSNLIYPLMNSNSQSTPVS